MFATAAAMLVMVVGAMLIVTLLLALLDAPTQVTV